jgi:hypothetical protein
MKYSVTTEDRKGKETSRENFNNRRKAWKRFTELRDAGEIATYRDNTLEKLQPITVN